MLALSISSVLAQYAPTLIIRVPIHILRTSGAPALTGSQFTGAFTALDADGQGVTLASDLVIRPYERMATWITDTP